jgi:hypothetical protein
MDKGEKRSDVRIAAAAIAEGFPRLYDTIIRTRHVEGNDSNEAPWGLRRLFLSRSRATQTAPSRRLVHLYPNKPLTRHTTV